MNTEIFQFTTVSDHQIEFLLNISLRKKMSFEFSDLSNEQLLISVKIVGYLHNNYVVVEYSTNIVFITNLYDGGQQWVCYEFDECMQTMVKIIEREIEKKNIVQGKIGKPQPVRWMRVCKNTYVFGGSRIALVNLVGKIFQKNFIHVSLETVPRAMVTVEWIECNHRQRIEPNINAEKKERNFSGTRRFVKGEMITVPNLH